MSRVCPECQSIFGESVDKCPIDGKDLEDFDADDDPLVGVVIDGRFRLDELLGAGGMGRVYRATQLSVERSVAVKLLRGEAIPDQQMKERFFREARVISEFSHPNIIRLVDFGNDAERGFPYLVMEMAGGLSLSSLIEEGRLAPELAIEIARQVCSGLLEAHSANIIHRDLKPDNLHLISLSDGTFHVKILDFGIAFPEEADQNLTATGMMCGTAAYVAPEQARASDIDGQADIYSLGIILFEMLTGVRPFRGESGFEIVMQQVQESPPPLERYVDPSKLPDGLIELVYDLLEKDPRKRPSGPASVRDRLDEIAGAMETDAPRLDLTRSDKAMFEPWLHSAVSPDEPLRSAPAAGGGDASAIDPTAPTGDQEAFEEETSPYERNRPLREGDPPAPADASGNIDEEASPPVRSGHTEIADSDARRAAASAHTTERHPEVNPVRRGLLLAAGGAAALLVVAGGLALWLSDEHDESADEAARATAQQADTGTAKADEAKTDGLEPIDGPLDAYAGRCTVIGESSEPFHTVYFYPDLGELVLRGDETLDWSRLEVEGRRDGRVVFGYRGDAGEGESEREGTTRKRSDKRFFTFDGSSEFICRHESYTDYYTQLGFRGTFIGTEEDAHRLDFPSGGQAFTLVEPAEMEADAATIDADAGSTETTYAYRLLEGRADEGPWTLAVRKKEGDSWDRWTMQRDGSDGLTVEQGDRERSYLAEGAEPPDDPEPTAKAPDRPEPAEPAAPAKPTPSPTPQPPPRQPAAGAGSKGEVPAQLQKRFEDLFARCEKTVGSYEALIKKTTRLGEQMQDVKMPEEEEKLDRLRAEQKKVSAQLESRRQSFQSKMSSIGQIYAGLLQELYRAGVPVETKAALREKYRDVCVISTD